MQVYTWLNSSCGHVTVVYRVEEIESALMAISKIPTWVGGLGRVEQHQHRCILSGCNARSRGGEMPAQDFGLAHPLVV